MRTVVLFPTAGEAEAFRRRCPGVAYRITGVGPAAAATATARAVVDERPDLLLLAGIAGVYPASEVAVGEVVAVAEERVEGLPERYADAYRPTFAVPGLRTAVSNSVARSGAAPAGAEVENMEGAAFFAVAAALGVPAAEVRAVSKAEQRVHEAIKLGFESCILPQVSLDKMKNTDKITLYGVNNVREAIRLI